MIKKILPGLVFAALLAIAFWAYRPGLAGGFLFDDFANLPSLGAYGPVDNTTTLGRYITSGTADPAGRPVALASFLLDANNWPANPYPFKRTNLLLHLINGLLLVGLLLALGRERSLPSVQARWAAVIGAGLWLLHPLWVSTTLYIVQREAMLPVTFTVLGLLGYIQGRRTLLAGRVWRGALLAAFSIGCATVLATLSKANGALLPLLALTLEYTVLSQPAQSPRALRRLRWLVLVLPCGVLALYLAHLFPYDLSVIPGHRSWSYGQRLLTEPRALWDYLRLLWLPHPYSTGLFNDQFKASTGLVQPWTTVPAVLSLGALFGAGIVLHRRRPIIAAAILFFLAGHLLESSFIALELYFEHRNYLPALLMFWPLACWLTAPGRRPQLKAIAIVVIILMLAGMTHMRATLWGESYEQALLWAQINPTSARAQTNAAQFEMAHGRPQAAAARLHRALAIHPDELQITLSLIDAQCQLGHVNSSDLQVAQRSFATALVAGKRVFDWLGKAADHAYHHDCAGLDEAAVQRFISAEKNNPHLSRIAGRRQDLLNIEGRIALLQGNARLALSRFNAALDEEVRPAVALAQAAQLGSAGFPCAGLAHLAHLQARRNDWQPAGSGMPQIHAWLLARQGYWSHEIHHIQAQLLHDARQKMPQGCPADLQIGDTGTSR